MKLKIISDGTPQGTSIVDIETGERLERVTSIKWSIDAKWLAVATIELCEIPVDIVGDFEKVTKTEI